MKLYAGTTEQFRTDAQLHRIADKLRTEYIATTGYKPGPAGHSATSADNAVVVELKQWSGGIVAGPRT